MARLVLHHCGAGAVHPVWQILGLLPATFACVFVAALGDRDTTLKGAAILSASVTVFGILLFSYLLKVSMPILKWGF